MSKKSLKHMPLIRFKGFSDEWEQYKLGDIVEVVSGGTPDTSNPDYWDGDINWYSPTEITDQIYVVESERKITEKGLQKSSAKMLPAEKTILFTSRAGIGKMAILRQSACTNQGFQSLVVKDSYEPYFVYSMGSQLKRKALAIASGSTFLEISGKMLSNLDVKIPSGEEQEKIASLHKQLDNLINLHQLKLDCIKIIKKVILNKLLPQNNERVPELRFKRFSDAWEQRKLSELTSLITKGTTPLDKSSNETINYVKIENIDSISGKVTITTKISEEEHNGYLKRSQLKKGDVLFSIAGTLGRVIIVSNDILPANTNQALAIIRLKNCNSDYIATYLKGNTIAEFVKKNPTVGAQPNLSLEQVGNLAIAIPSIDEQEHIGSFFLDLSILINLHQHELTILKNIKTILSNHMFI